MAKIRNGFVSNSSSSSFIIASKKEPEIKIKINVREICDYVVKTKEDLDLVIKERFYVDEINKLEDYDLIIYNKCLKSLEDGNEIYFGTVANDYDDEIGNFIYRSGFGKEVNFDIIQDLG